MQNSLTEDSDSVLDGHYDDSLSGIAPREIPRMNSFF